MCPGRFQSGPQPLCGIDVPSVADGQTAVSAKSHGPCWRSRTRPLEQLGGQHLLDHDPCADLAHRSHDAALPAGRDTTPLERESGLPAVAMGDPARPA